MTHAALTPLLGSEFDNFLYASIGDEPNGPLLSLASALARIGLDPWTEAASLARMPKERAKERLTSLIASLPVGSITSRPPEATAAQLVALLPRSGGVNISATPWRPANPAQPSRLVLGLILLGILLLGYFIFAA